MLPGASLALQTAVHCITLAAMLGLGLAIHLAAPAWRETHREVPRSAWWALAALLSVQLAITAAVVPAAPWHSFYHGIERAHWLETMSLWDDRQSGNLHGTAAYALMRIGSLGLWSPMRGNMLLAAATTAFVFLAAQAVSADTRLALCAAAVHALLPVRLRVAPTLTLYVVSELLLVVSVWAAAVHARTRDRTAFAAAACALVLAMHAHMEMIVLAPVWVLVTVLSVDPAWLKKGARDRTLLLGIAALVLVTLPLVARLWTAVEGHIPGAPATVDPAQAGIRVRLLAIAALLAALGVVGAGRPVGDEGPRRWAAGAVVLGALLITLPREISWLTTPFNGTLRLHDTESPWALGHALLSAELTPAAWVGMALAGLALSWTRGPPLARWLLWLPGPAFVFYAGTHDIQSTYVRVALPLAPWFSWCVGVTLATALGRITPARSAAVVLALCTMLLAPRLGWLGWRFPSQVEYTLMEDAKALRRTAVVAPTTADVPPIARGSGPDMHHFLAEAFEPLTGLAEATAESLPDGTLYLRTLPCFRVPEISLEIDGAPRTALWAAGRAWSIDPQGSRAQAVKRHRACWADPDQGVCAAKSPSGCALWTCPDTARIASAAAPYMDPACAAFEASHRLIAVREEPVPAGSLFGEAFPDGAVIGLYRVEGRRP